MPRFSVRRDVARQSSWNQPDTCLTSVSELARSPTPLSAPPLACCHCRTIPGVAKPCGYRPLLLLRITDGSSKNMSVTKCSFAFSVPLSGR